MRRVDAPTPVAPALAVPAVASSRVARPSPARAGMTLLELLVVLALLATAAALTAPKTLALLRSARTASARRQLAAVAEAARAGAIQRQRPATLQIVPAAGGTRATATASVDTGGLKAYVIARQVLEVPVAWRVAGDDSVVYDARGMLTPRRTAAQGPVVYLLGPASGSRDSVCLSAYGHIMPRDCAQ